MTTPSKPTEGTWKDKAAMWITAFLLAWLHPESPGFQACMAHFLWQADKWSFLPACPLPSALTWHFSWLLHGFLTALQTSEGLKKSSSWALVAHTCNANYVGGWHQNDWGSRPAQANNSKDIISEITRAKWTGGVAQVVREPALQVQRRVQNPSPTKKKKKKKKNLKYVIHFFRVLTGKGNVYNNDLHDLLIFTTKFWYRSCCYFHHIGEETEMYWGWPPAWGPITNELCSQHWSSGSRVCFQPPWDASSAGGAQESQQDLECSPMAGTKLSTSQHLDLTTALAREYLFFLLFDLGEQSKAQSKSSCHSL
jgi:hypothetical protein